MWEFYMQRISWQHGRSPWSYHRCTWQMQLEEWINGHKRIAGMYTLILETWFFWGLPKINFSHRKELQDLWRGSMKDCSGCREGLERMVMSLNYWTICGPNILCSMWTKFMLDADHPQRETPPRGPSMVMDRLKLVLDKILDLRTTEVVSAMIWEFFVR